MSNSHKCDVSLPFRAHVHSDNSERLKAYGKKRKRKKDTGTKPTKQTKITFHPSCLDQQHSRWFSLLSTTIKLQTRMKRFVAVIAILKNGLFLKSAQNTKRRRGEGPSRCPQSLRTHGRDVTKKTRHAPPVLCEKGCVTKNAKNKQTNKLQKMV